MQRPDSSFPERTFPRAKTPVRLPEFLSQRLNAYTATAAAAGVGVLACAMPAEAAPVCKSLSVELRFTNTYPLNPAGQGAAPFNIAQTRMSYSPITTGHSTFLWLNRGFLVPNTAGAKALLGPDDFPADVAFGAEIGPSGKFGKGASYGLLFTYGFGNLSRVGGGTKLKHRGNLDLTQENYLGYQFSESGQVHYGWARLTVTYENPPDSNTVIHIQGYGYESSPKTAIAAGNCGTGEKANTVAPASDTNPQKQSLGELALGATGRR
ncbi:MAG TPA: hypothetical protein VND65_18605 [Candidatus Binatia bacterium]|nr:hypothetical protein [Candidatus Binatia bacterium]